MHLLLLLIAVPGTAQIISDKPVQLEGASNAERQVRGLADATSAGDALNARTHQAGSYVYAEASGLNDWSIDLLPAPATLDTGMCLLVKAGSDITGPVTLVVNGMGPHPVVKDGGSPLAPGDVVAGETASLVFDGASFQMIGARRIARRDCPSGFVPVNELYCIETDQRDTVTFYQAAVTCGDLGGRLCSWGEWYAACANASALGLNGMVGDWEWTNNAANADLSARVAGQSTCTHAGVTSVISFSRNFRCCYKR